MTGPNSSPPTDTRLLLLAPEDNVCVATTTLDVGESLVVDGEPIEVADRIPTGHKMAVVPIAEGQSVMKYGASIGSATRDVHAGQHVHTHNLKSDYLPTYTPDNPFEG